MKHPDGRSTVVPIHGGETLGVGLRFREMSGLTGVETEGILGHTSQLVPVRVVGDAMGQIRKHFWLAETYPGLGNVIELNPSVGPLFCN